MAPPPTSTIVGDAAPTSTEETKPKSAKRKAAEPGVPGAPLPKKLRSAYDVFKYHIDMIPAQRARNYEFEGLKSIFPDLKWDPLGDVDVGVDRGVNADPEFNALFEAATEVEHLTPVFGSVIYGVSLAELTDPQKDELARFVAFRGVVFFRDQADLDVKKQLALGRYWGPLHRHASTGLPKDSLKDEELLDVHVVWGDERKLPRSTYSQAQQWHTDSSYEKQPPAYTSLKILQAPIGGDTLWTSCCNLYDQLSPMMQKYLENHSAVHSVEEQAADAVKAGNFVRRPPVSTLHPLVRVHPVTGFKSVYANEGFVRRIEGVPVSESTSVLKYLFELMSTNATHSVRWKWRDNDVAIWDNRSTAHAAVYGCYPAYRHAVRVTVTGEKPYGGEGISQNEQLEEELGFTLFDKTGAGGSYND